MSAHTTKFLNQESLRRIGGCIDEVEKSQASWIEKVHSTCLLIGGRGQAGSKLMIKALALVLIFLSTSPLGVKAAPLSSTALTTLQLPTNCIPPASAGCGTTTQPRTAFGAVLPDITTLFPPSHPTGFTGTWDNNVAPAWIGTFAATGFYPEGLATASTSIWDFAGLSHGSLPVGTFVGLGDVDAFGAAEEKYELTAFDAFAKAITSPWLDDVFFISSISCATECVQTSMPEYQWSALNGVYSFDGLNVTGNNPTVTVWVPTNTLISGLSVKKFSHNNSFVLAAPVAIPEPNSLLLVLLSLFAASFMSARGRRSGFRGQVSILFV